MKRVLGLLLVLITILTACGKDVRLTEMEAMEVIEKSLEKKYSKDFQIESITIVESGQMISNEIFVATVTEVTTDSNSEFEASISINGKDFKDSYLSSVYDTSIREDVLNILSNHDNIEFYFHDVNYELSEYEYKSLEDYIQNNNVIIIGEITLQDEETEVACDKCYAVLEDLHKKGYNYNLSIVYKGERIYESYMPNYSSDLITKEALLNRLKNIK